MLSNFDEHSEWRTVSVFSIKYCHSILMSLKYFTSCRDAVSATSLESTSCNISVAQVDNNPINKSIGASSKDKEDPSMTKKSPSQPKNDQPFVKPSRGRKLSAKGSKQPVALKISGKDKKSLDCLEKNDLSDNHTKLGAEHSLSVDSAVSEKNKRSGAQDEPFPLDSFATPKKPRKSSNKSSDISSNSKAKEKINSITKSTPRKNNTPGRELVKKNYKGETPLHVACIKGNVARVRSLLEANATPNTKDNAGWTPLVREI